MDDTRAVLDSLDFGGGEALKVLYLATTGPGDATKASIPLHLAANGSVDVGHETTIVLGGDGTELMLGDTADTLEGVGVPPVRELLQKLVDNAVPVYV